jgi:hypothetical protein
MILSGLSDDAIYPFTSYEPEAMTYSLPNLEHRGSNWVVWKHRIQTLIEAKWLAHHLDHSTPPPPKPGALVEGATGEDTKIYDKAVISWKEWRQADLEVRHYIISTIPDALVIKTLNATPTKALWEAIIQECEIMSKPYQAEVLRRLQNERCAEGEDVRSHFAKMLKFHGELAATGKTVTDDHFTSILTNSLPTSTYGTIFTILEMQDKPPASRQLIEAVEEYYMRCQMANGGGSSAALFTNPQSPSISKLGRKKDPNRCTNTRCGDRHTHEFKDCRSEGGPQYEPNPLPVRNPQNNQNIQEARGNRNARQMMKANVAQDAEEEFVDRTFTTIGPFNITDITANGDPPKHVEIYSSGAACHMSPYIEAFTDFEFIKPKPISTIDNRIFEAVGKGNIHVKIPNGNKFTSVTLREVLYAPDLAFTLISLNRADEAGCTTIIEDGELRLIDRAKNNKVIGRIPVRDGLWKVTSTKTPSTVSTHAQATSC